MDKRKETDLLDSIRKDLLRLTEHYQSTDDDVAERFSASLQASLSVFVEQRLLTAELTKKLDNMRMRR